MKKSIIKIALSLSTLSLPLCALGIHFISNSISHVKNKEPFIEPTKVTYLDDDGSLLYETSYKDGDEPTYLGPLPKKESDDAYIYTFANWEEVSSDLSGTVTYKATYYHFNKTYKITWLDFDDTILEVDYVKSLTYPEYNGKNLDTFEIDGEIYKFSHWGGEGLNSEVRSDLIFKANYTKTLIKHKVTFVNENGEIHESKEYNHGEVPTFNGATPKKENDEGYTYTFIGWDKPISPLLEDTTYVAMFEKTPKKFKVTWKNYDGEILSEEEYEYLSIPSYKGVRPTLTFDDGYFYDFIGWNNGLNPITKNETFTAMFKRSENKYLVEFYQFERLVYADYVKQGETPIYKGKDISTYKDDYYDYSFTKRDKPLLPCFSDTVFNAIYNVIDTHEFKVSFVDQNDQILHTSNVKYNEFALFPSTLKTPTYKTDNGTYSFTRREPNINLPIKGDTVFKPVFTLLDKTYTVTFYNYDNTIFDVIEVTRNSLLTYDRIPKKPGTSSTHFEFVRWNKDFGKVTQDMSYYPVFEEKINVYTIRFINDGHDLIKTELVEHGSYPTLDQMTPTSYYNPSYNFSGWTPRISKATSDMTYRATYTSRRVYNVRFEDYDGTLIKNIPVTSGNYSYYYGDKPTRESDVYGSYTFSSRDQNFKYIYNDETYIARYTPSSGRFHVKFLNKDDSLLYEYDTYVGNYPRYPYGTPTYNGDNNHNYYFISWDKSFNYVYEHQTYKAVYNEVKIINHIYKNYDDEVLFEERLEEGISSSYQGETPTKPDSGNEKYTFNRFVIEEETEFEKIYRARYFVDTYYDVVFKDYDGKILETFYLNVGQVPNPTVIPTREDDIEKRIRYRFKSWDKELAHVMNEQTYTALYEEIPLLKATFNVNGLLFEEVYFIEGDDPETLITKRPNDKYEQPDNTGAIVERFSGYELDSTLSNGDRIYNAIYSKQLYTITYYDGDNEVVDAKSAYYGETIPTSLVTPKKSMGSDLKPYAFSGWETTGENITRGNYDIHSAYDFYGLEIISKNQFTYDKYGYEYKSINKSHYSRGYIELRVLESKSFTLKYETSTEKNYDKLIITYTDSNGSTKSINYSGVTSGTKTMNLQMGSILKLEYSKDGSIDSYNNEVKVTFLA